MTCRKKIGVRFLNGCALIKKSLQCLLVEIDDSKEVKVSQGRSAQEN